MKKIIFIFGQIGAGKNKVGADIASHRNYEYFDSNNFLNIFYFLGILILKPVVKKFVTDRLIPGIEKLQETNNNLVIGCTLYTEDHRRMLYNNFNKTSEVKFVYVNTPKEQHEEQLYNSYWASLIWTGWFWLAMAKFHRSSFEIPNHTSPKFVTFNNTYDKGLYDSEISHVIEYLEQEISIDNSMYALNKQSICELFLHLIYSLCEVFVNACKILFYSVILKIIIWVGGPFKYF